MQRPCAAQMMDLPLEIMEIIFLKLLTVSWNFSDFATSCKTLVSIMLANRAHVRSALIKRQYFFWNATWYGDHDTIGAYADARTVSEDEKGDMLQHALRRHRLGHFDRLHLDCGIIDFAGDFKAEFSHRAQDVLQGFPSSDLAVLLEGWPVHKVVLTYHNQVKAPFSSIA